MANPDINTVSGWRCRDIWEFKPGPFDGECAAADATCRLVRVTYGAGTTKFKDTIAWFSSAEAAAAALELLYTPAIMIARLSASNRPLSAVVEYEVL